MLLPQASGRSDAWGSLLSAAFPQLRRLQLGDPSAFRDPAKPLWVSPALISGLSGCENLSTLELAQSTRLSSKLDAAQLGASLPAVRKLSCKAAGCLLISALAPQLTSLTVTQVHDVLRDPAGLQEFCAALAAATNLRSLQLDAANDEFIAVMVGLPQLVNVHFTDYRPLSGSAVKEGLGPSKRQRLDESRRVYLTF